jgi:peptidoglycan hydrolase-like protein with peptidoglycan-binding domain
MKIIESIVNNGHGALNPQYLFIHETANPGATALNHVNYWRSNGAYAVHYVCDWTGNVYHCVPDNRKCWQVGNGNGYGVGIEICHAKNQADFNSVYATAVEFAAYYLKKRGWNISHMMSHHQAAQRWGGSTHTDPDSYFAQFGKSWSQFVSDVNARMGSGTTSTPVSTPSQNVANTTGELKVQVLINDLYIRPTPGSKQHKGFTGKGVFTITQVQNNWGKLKSGAGWIYIGNPSYTKILGGAAPTASASAPAPVTHRFHLSVDGILGSSSVKAMQSWLGTTVDGVVSSQSSGCKKYLQACPTSNWKFVNSGAHGSLMIKKLQQTLGVGADGLCGKGTVTALQKFLKNKGYNISADGYLGANTAKALQKYLNTL